MPNLPCCTAQSSTTQARNISTRAKSTFFIPPFEPDDVIVALFAIQNPTHFHLSPEHLPSLLRPNATWRVSPTARLQSDEKHYLAARTRIFRDEYIACGIQINLLSHDNMIQNLQDFIDGCIRQSIRILHTSPVRLQDRYEVNEARTSSHDDVIKSP